MHVYGKILLAVGMFTLPLQEPAIVWDLKDGIATPESVYYDAESGYLFSSQIGGQEAGDGRIVRISVDGKKVDADWVTGLGDPLGIRSHKGTLWVADSGQLVAIDIAKAEIVKKVSIPGAQSLNDVVCDPEGAVYVSDTLGSRIHRLKGDEVSTVAEGDDVEGPNGLLIDGDRLIVAAWGLAESDFSTKVPGRLFALDLKTKKKELITPDPFANMDGLEFDGQGGYLVTDWNAGKVLRVGPDGKSEVLLQLAKGIADHAYIGAKKLLVVPHMEESRVVAYDLSSRLK